MVRASIFVSYSHRDESQLETLLPYLATLEREQLVTVWSDSRIRQGERWRQEIDSALDAASIAILLVSQQFLASAFVRDEELPRILKRQLEGRLTALPVFLSPSTVKSLSIPVIDLHGREKGIELSEFQGFGTPDKTLSELELPEQQRRFVALHNRIRELTHEPHDGIQGWTTGGIEFGRQPAHPRWPRVSSIPFRRNRTFTGREGALRRLREGLESGVPAAVTQALTGLGGIGKTQLTLEYCYRYGADYEVVWWIRAEHQETCLGDIRALATALGRNTTSEATSVVTWALDWLDHHDHWLLVFDNVEHPADIRALLPSTGRGRIIITSRNQAWGSLAQTVRLDLWTPEEAADYVTRRTALSSSAAARAIAETLGYLPLALAQAAGYIEETGCGFDGYLQLLNARPEKTLALRPNSSDAERAIATVWDIAFEKVAASNQAAVDLLNLFAFLPPDRIPRRLLIDHAEQLQASVRETVRDPFALDEAIGALRRYSLIETTPDTFSMHRLVQAVVRARIHDNDTYRLLSETAKDIAVEDSEPPPSHQDTARVGFEELPKPSV